LAAACQRFTPTVSLELAESVLLEVRASLALFGGIARLEQALTEMLSRRTAGFRLATAPTPLAAVWLARAGGGNALSESELLSCIGGLPLRVTGWPDAVQEMLEGIGVR